MSSRFVLLLQSCLLDLYLFRTLAPLPFRSLTDYPPIYWSPPIQPPIRQRALVLVLDALLRLVTHLWLRPLAGHVSRKKKKCNL